MGSAAALALARRGLRVVGLDRHPPGHLLGASHGGSRIIRSAYFEGPTYVPLVRRAEALWRGLENGTGEHLLVITGGLFAGSPAGPLVAGSRRSAEAHAIPYELLDAPEVLRRWPGFRLGEGEVGLFEPGAGVLDPERGVAAQLALAGRLGARLLHDTRVTGWSARPGGVTVQTSGGSYDAGALVLAAGAWSGPLLGEVGTAGGSMPLRVERRLQHWFAPADPHAWATAPVWIWERPDGASAYGFPLRDGACKIGVHARPDREPAVDVESLDREVSDADVDLARRDVTAFVPGVAAGRHLRSDACSYTLTPDEHFVVDRHPGHDNVAIGCGFSGHGFKFAPVIGELLADLAIGRPPSSDIAAFGIGRSALDPAVTPAAHKRVKGPVTR